MTMTMAMTMKFEQRVVSIYIQRFSLAQRILIPEFGANRIELLD